MFTSVLTLEIQLSRGESWRSTNRFNPATCLCLSPAWTWFSNIICCCFFYVQWIQRWFFCFADIGGIVGHHYLNFLFIPNTKTHDYLNTCLTKLTFASKFWKIKLRSRSKVRTSSWMCASSFLLLPLLTCKDSKFNLEYVCFICSIIFSARPTEKESRF